MIVTNIKDVNRYKTLSPEIAKAIEYIQSNKWKDLPTDKKRYPIYPNEVEAMRMTYEASEDGTWESHENWIDIQMIISGEEIMRFAPTNTLKKEGEFLKEKDYQKWSGVSTQELLVNQDELIFFFPEDGHIPNIRSIYMGSIDKVVIKVKV